MDMDFGNTQYNGARIIDGTQNPKQYLHLTYRLCSWFRRNMD